MKNFLAIIKKKVHHRHYYLELLELELELSFSFAVWSMNGSACLVVMTLVIID